MALKQSFTKIAGVILVAAIIAFSGYWFFFNQSSDQTDQTQKVKVTKGEIAPTLTITGTVASENEVDLNFKSGGELTDIYVKVGDSVSAGQELAQIDDVDLQKELKIAKASLNSAKAQFRQLKKSTPTEIKTQEIEVNKALASFENAKKNLQSVEASAAQDLTSAQTALDNAKRDMDLALSRREEAVEEWESLVKKYEHPVYHLPNYTASQQNEIDAAKSTADSAYDKYISAETQYKTAQQNLSSAQFKAQSEIDSAKNQLSQAEDQYQSGLLQLEAKKTGPTTDDKTIQQASVTQAEENYNAAEKNLKQAVLVSPIDGVVISINGNVGEEVSGGGAASGSAAAASSSSTAFIVIADLTKLKVTAAVDQADIPKVSKGQIVVISLDAFPDQEFKGKVTSVDPNPVVEQNVVTYSISVSIDNPDPKVQLGMGATLKIDLGRKENVLVVPNLAVRSVSGQKVVRKVIDGSSTDVKVEVGLSDDDNTEIISGLEEGDEIEVGVFTGTSQETQGNSQRTGGGFGIPGMGRMGGGR
ncbi:MAG: efflux RND transporter periplasmic adaptor subunit [Actinobacteria bacterium]|nr:efflux RND transporter periplasmic adaptor subunit [Actinomycetota bacterium]